MQYFKKWPGVYFHQQRKLWLFKCKKEDCFLAVTVQSEQAGLDLESSHKCPHSGQTRIAWTVYGPSLLEKTWAELDFYTARIIEDGGKEYDKGYARGLAHTLSLFMIPHFTTADAVVAEAVKRYKAKKAGETDYCTAGLASRAYEAPPEDYKLDMRPYAAPIKSPSMKMKLKEEEVIAIQAGAAMFSPEEMAKIYKVTVAEIKAVLSPA